MKKWEYKILNRTQLTDLELGMGINSALNNLGEKGWELLHVETDNETGFTEYYFKKEKK